MEIDCATLGSLLVNPSQNGAPNDLYSYPPLRTTQDPNDEYAELIPFPGRTVSVVGTINESCRTFQTHKETKEKHSHLFFLSDYTGETIPVHYHWTPFQLLGAGGGEEEEGKTEKVKEMSHHTTFFMDTCKYCSDIKNCMDKTYIHVSGNLKSCGSKDHATNRNKLKIMTSSIRCLLPPDMKYVTWHQTHCEKKKQNLGKISSSLPLPPTLDSTLSDKGTKKEEEDGGLFALFRGGKKLNAFDIAIAMEQKVEDVVEILKDLHQNKGAIYCDENQIELPFATIKWTLGGGGGGR